MTPRVYLKHQGLRGNVSDFSNVDLAYRRRPACVQRMMKPISSVTTGFRGDIGYSLCAAPNIPDYDQAWASVFLSPQKSY